ncbi:MAG: twin-arginine translocation signal domain-containing protein [Pseudomonadota bacterium]
MTRKSDQQVLDRIIAAGRRRTITRRSFVAHATVVGLTVPAVTGLWTSKVAASTPS